MKLKRLFFFFLLLSSHYFITARQLEGLPFITSYSTKDYQGGIQNWAITQSENGLIYVANNFGLLEFDGTEWKRYPMPNSTKIRDVLEGSDHKIYIASQGDFGYFNPNPQGVFTYYSLADSLPEKYRNFDETWRVFEDDGKIFFCTFRQIFIFEKGDLVKVIEPSIAPENFYFVNRILFVNQIEVGLSYLSNDSLQLFDKGDFFQGKTITGVLPLNEQKLWVATLNNGVYIYDGEKYLPWNPQNNQDFIQSSINCALRMTNGNIAIGTQNNGLYITDVDGKIIQHLTKDKGLNNRTILSLYEDLLGNLWLGHNNGITNVELNLPFSIINEETKLPGTGYDAYLADNQIYLGTNNGIYTKDLDSELNANYSFIENTEGQVYDIQEIDNQILIGHHRGTFQFIDERVSQASEILGSWTFLKMKGHPGYVIGGTYKGILLFKQQGNKLQFVRKLKGFSESSRIMEEDEKGNIWMTHGYKGVFKLKINNELDSVYAKYYGVQDGLPSKLLINVWKINNQLVFTTRNGVYNYDDEQDNFVKNEFFTQYFSEDIQINYLQQDPLGNIYFLAELEFGVLQKLPNGLYEKKTKIFNRLKGLLNDDLQNLSVLNADYVMYGAKEGFILYSKNADNMKEVPYQTLIREIHFLTPSDSIICARCSSNDPKVTSFVNRFSYENNSLRFEFSAPFFHSSNKTEYQYFLEGFDQDWSKWDTKTEKEYTNLHEGSYRFRVRSKNIYDQISEEATFEFIVLAPWYRSKTAYLVYTLFVVALLFTAYYFLEIRHKKEKKLLRLKQQQAINNMDRELRSSEEEIQRLKNEKLQSEVDSKNKELALSTMHLLNKNSFINSIKHDIGSVIKRSKNQEVKKELNKIASSIDKNIAEDDDWEHFAIHFDQVHGDFTRRLQDDFPDLTPQEMKLSAYLRMNLSTKEIAHLLNISVRGVEIARYRLRKKLSLERSVNLQKFILEY